MARRGIKKSDLSKRAAKHHEAIARGAPELLSDTDFAHPYVTRKPTQKPAQTERTEVQRPLVNFLRGHLPRGSVVFAITNHARSKTQVFALMRDGMLPGFPDIGIISRVAPQHGGGRFVGFIEAKRPGGGVLSEAQKFVQAEIRELGLPVLAECRSVQEAVDWLREQGVEVR